MNIPLRLAIITKLSLCMIFTECAIPRQRLGLAERTSIRCSRRADKNWQNLAGCM